MKRFLIFICMFSLFFAAKAEQRFISGPDYSGVSSFSDYVVYVENGVIVSVPGSNITMSEPIYLYNHGRINGTIFRLLILQDLISSHSMSFLPPSVNFYPTSVSAAMRIVLTSERVPMSVLSLKL